MSGLREASVKDDPRFSAAIAAFDRDNAQDPNQEAPAGVPRPRELLQAERFTDWLARLRPDAPEALWLAVRCQHIRRWERPRASYPEGRAGYLRWRRDLVRFHADTAARILRSVGYDDAMVARVRTLNLKLDIKRDPDAQTLEDVLCLSFIAHELESFQHKQPHDKLLEIVSKTWQKMSEPARALALQAELSPQVRGLIDEALAQQTTR